MTLIDDEPKALLAALVLVLVAATAWTALDRRSRASRAVRARWSPQTTRLTVVLLALAVFYVLVEDVVDREHDELVLTLDREIRAALRPVTPAFRSSAALASRLGGEWLAVAVALSAAGLVAVRRRSEAAVLVGGTLTASGASLALKTAFAAPRPRGHAILVLWDGGFPSGHTFVTLVACGLTVWALGRGAAPVRRLLLLTAAALVISIVGVSRIVLDAHWLSDVLGGLAIGAVWTSLVVTVAELWLPARSRHSDDAPAPSDHPFLGLGEAERT